MPLNFVCFIMQMLQSSVDLFYGISGVPNKDVQPKYFSPKGKTFIQSTSQGARCLKRGDIVLYKVIIILF